MKKTLTDIDGALAVQRATADRPPLEGSREKSARPRPYKQTDRTFGFYKRKEGHLGMGDKVVGLGGRREILYVEDGMYDLTDGLNTLITHRRPLRKEYIDHDYKTYRALVVQTNVRKSPNPAGAVNPYRNWKWKHMLGMKEKKRKPIVKTQTLVRWKILMNQLILVYYHLVYHHRLTILALMGKLKRRRVENLFIKVTKVMK